MGSGAARSFHKKAKVQILMHPIIFSSLGKMNQAAVISNAQIKLIRSLRQKKFRDHYRLYLVEGEKMVAELMENPENSRHRAIRLFATSEYLDRNKDLFHRHPAEVMEATKKELEKISNLVTPQTVLAMASLPDALPLDQVPPDEPVLAFDSIRDPGNLGTILRTADWFGIHHVVCSPDSADLYNPKVVQSTMGALFRVEVIYADLPEWLSMVGKGERQILGTFLEGTSLYEVPLKNNPVILFGNESKGLPDHYDPYLTQKISIPPFHRGEKGPESLNIAASVAVICSEMRRKK
jgi:TrmH family RNA methyltransferase